MEEPQIEVIEKDDGTLEAGPAQAPVSGDDIALIPYQGYFNITGQLSGRAKSELADIVEFARGEADSEDPAQVLMALRNIEHRLKVPKLDESRLSNVYNYVKQLKIIKAAEEQRNSFVR